MKFNDTLFQMPNYDFHIFTISIVKVIGVLKAYIMYLMKIKELFPLSFNAYTFS